MHVCSAFNAEVDLLWRSSEPREQRSVALEGVCPLSCTDPLMSTIHFPLQIAPLSTFCPVSQLTTDDYIGVIGFEATEEQEQLWETEKFISVPVILRMPLVPIELSDPYILVVQ